MCAITAAAEPGAGSPGPKQHNAAQTGRGMLSCEASSWSPARGEGAAIEGTGEGVEHGPLGHRGGFLGQLLVPRLPVTNDNDP